MQQLKNLLELAVDQASFDVGRIEENKGGVRISYAFRRQELVTREQLSEMIATKGWEAGKLHRASRAKLVLCDELFTELENLVRCLLQDCIDPETDRIGHAFPTGGDEVGHIRHTEQSWVSAVVSFTKALVKGAAVVGPQNAAEQLQRWLEGRDPVRYCEAGILNGVAFTEPLAPLKGVRIEPLPLSSDDLPVHLPRPSGLSADDYLGRTVLYIEREASPALFRPGPTSRETSVTVRDVPGVDFDAACQALSLECDTYVETGFYWNYYQGLPGLMQVNYNSWSFGNQRLDTWPLTTHVQLADWHLADKGTLFPNGISGPLPSEERLGETLKAIKDLHPDHTTRTAISRWMRSRDDKQSLVDRYIDLRIALEALYLEDFLDERTTQEMRFRLALFGAWHLGDNFKERQSIRKKVRDSYDRASAAVHGGSIAYDSKSRELLSDGQGLCRKGIQKVLRQGLPKNWGDLILGVEYADDDLDE